MEKTYTGLEENVAALLCYILGWISGIVFLIIEKENKFVRFHAKQSIVTFGIINLFTIALSIFAWIPFIGVIFTVIAYLAGILAFILWIVLMVKAYGGAIYRLPWAGNIAEKWTV